MKKEKLVVKVSDEELKDLKLNIERNNLSEKEKNVVLGILEAYLWLLRLYHLKKLSLKKIMRLFGHQSEKQKDEKGKDKGDGGDRPSGKRPKKKGHGRNGKDDFPGAEKQYHPLEKFKAGDDCPECPLGKLYPVRPGVYIHFEGRAPLEAVIHEVEKLRCNACGIYFEAEIEAKLKIKYAPSVDVAIVTQKYALWDYLLIE